MPTEEVIVTTYPPPDSGSSNDSSFEQIDQQTLNATHANEIRRESDWSSTTGETSRRGSDMPLIPKRTVVPKVVDELPPLCAFVVDDDRYVPPCFLLSLSRYPFSVDGERETEDS